MQKFLVQVGFARRRHGAPIPTSGPLSPPYLTDDVAIRYVWVAAEDAMEAELTAFDVASALTHDGNQRLRRQDPMPNLIMVGADMITSLRTVEAIL